MSIDQQIEKRARADAHFRAREILKADAEQARYDYYAAQAAIVDRTKRLRKERLAREAREAKQASSAARRP
jgi:hypothetical protein